MRLLDELRAEHELIERVVGSLAGFAASVARGEAAPGSGQGYARFFELYAGRYHHAREEQVLFPALVHETEAPAHRGPIAALLADHQAMGSLLAEMAPLLAPGAAPEPLRLVELSARYGAALLHHIDAENTVLLPESEIRFRRAATSELACRPPDDEEAQARDHGSYLVEAYPPIPLEGVHRGDGCVACPAYGAACEGIEREWWSELEWEDAMERMG